MWKYKCHDACILLSNSRAETWREREREKETQRENEQCGQVLTKIQIKKKKRTKEPTWHVKT